MVKESSYLQRPCFSISASYRFGRKRYFLHLDQWQLEAQRLFNVSLARMQTEIIAMTRTVEPRADHYLGNYFSNRSVNSCGMIKLNADGWRNVSVVGLAGMLGLALGLWLVTMEVGHTIVLVWLYQKVASPALVLLFAGLQSTYRFASKGFYRVYRRI